MKAQQYEAVAEAYDAGFLDGQKEAYRKLVETKRRIEVLITKAVARGEYESLVVARQILRGLK